MDPDFDYDEWIRDARSRGMPVAFCGMVLLWTCLGLPLWFSVLLLGLLMAAVLLWGASVSFPTEGPDSPGS